MMQRTSNENAACKRRICKGSDQPKMDRIANNDQFVMEIEKNKIFKGKDIEDISRWREFMNFKFYKVFLPREHKINMFEFR